MGATPPCCGLRMYAGGGGGGSTGMGAATGAICTGTIVGGGGDVTLLKRFGLNSCASGFSFDCLGAVVVVASEGAGAGVGLFDASDDDDAVSLLDGFSSVSDAVCGLWVIGCDVVGVGVGADVDVDVDAATMGGD